MRELALFAGAGGGLLASRLLGLQTVGAVEINPFCRDVLKARQDGGVLEDFPIYADVRSFDATPWRGRVDIVTGGFPCQDISSAGRKEGIDGVKSSLWWEQWRICCEVGSRFLFVENSPDLAVRGLGDILGALASRGWNAEWICLSAAALGAPHIRDRIWLLACDPNRDSQPGGAVHDEMARMPSMGRQWDPPRWPDPPDLGGVVDGMAAGVHRQKRLQCLGNGQVPRVAAAAFSILWERLMGGEHG